MRKIFESFSKHHLIFHFNPYLYYYNSMWNNLEIHIFSTIQLSTFQIKAQLNFRKIFIKSFSVQFQAQHASISHTKPLEFQNTNPKLFNNTNHQRFQSVIHTRTCLETSALFAHSPLIAGQTTAISNFKN